MFVTLHYWIKYLYSKSPVNNNEYTQIIMLTSEQLDSLKEILSTSSPSGCEGELTSLLKLRMSSLCEIESDVIGNIYMWVSRFKQAPTIMITAHADEVGFQVTHIDNSGFVYFRAVASPDLQTIPGSQVVALTNNGKIYGVIGKKSPHVQDNKEREKSLIISDLWIDFGFESEAEAAQYLECGDYITLFSEPKINHNKTRITSKALDNKICVFILTEIAKKLYSNNLRVNVVCVATAQEELGCRGSIVAANKINPDVAFILDVGIATDIPNMSKQKYGTFELGKGVGIIRNADNNEHLTSILADIAYTNKISYQKTIGHRPTGGTESATIQLAQQGISTANLSIPNRYMHSQVEMCYLRDVESAIDLITASIVSISESPINLTNETI